jgi:hypothetical protein
MRKLSILTLITLGLVLSVSAQVDINNARANPKTFIFDDEKHTVHGYIYNTLKEKTSCCGNDAIYLEVKFDQSGVVTSAKTLTGKSDCYKKSIVDIVQKVKWDATGVSGSKTIYFEVKPIIPCSGSPGENVYKPVGDGNVVASVEPKKEGSEQTGNGGNLTDKADTEEKTVVVEKEEPKKEEVVAVKEEPKKEEESFLSDDEPKKEEPKKEVAVKETIKEEPKKETIKEPSPKETVKQPVVKASEPVKTAPVAEAKTKPSGPIKLPPQEKLTYVSRGDAKPDASHQETHADIDIKGTGAVKYSDESTFGVNLRTALRNSGYCGLAQALVELETDPNTGRVISSRVMQVNDPKVAELVPGVIKDLKFNPTRSVANRYIYTEFKTEIVCQGQKPKYDLDQVGDFLSKPEANNGN